MRDHIVSLDADHPGFSDPEYRRRRDEIALMAPPMGSGEPPRLVDYTRQERETWATVFAKLTKLYPSHACGDFIGVIDEIGFSTAEVPQLRDVSRFLTRKTGFQLQPVAGLVSAREFLEALSRRVFCSTQYLRHHSQPFYTPEPDIVHELMGHAPMLAIPEFADLSQTIGEGSLNADDAQIEQLATLYWFTIEYGVVRDGGGLRAYGAGLLSSYGELEHALSGDVEIRSFDPWEAKDTPYPITTYQPLLWSVGSIREAFDTMAEFVASL
ncbi:MAG: phenylalanine 4-monooxygenase [Thermoanaerobaculales bacterium]|jgi:phenylalanine-4-hydroxylase|nr:phenylalanine 4-monooxygenase [Thermoanaerobaculales bacterium]